MYKKNKCKIIILCSICICLILSSVFINKNYNVPDFFLKDIFYSINDFISRPFSSISKNYSSLEAENERLKAELENLKNDSNDFSELRDENKRLKDLLKLNKLVSDKEYVNASVIGRDFQYWNDRLLIDKGSDDGISNNMAVLSNGSLIGITDDVSHSNCSVILLSNYKFPINISVKVKIGNGEVFGILNKYNDGYYEIMGIVENIEIPKDSKVVTTGYGNIFPSGLLVGSVDSVTTDNFDLSKIVRVNPKIDFDDISYVTIVKRDDK